MNITNNILRIRERIAAAANRAGRNEQILLVAAAKSNNASAVREAVLAGVDAVGENRVQELLDKNAEGAYKGAPLHFIGHLQSNKVKNVVGVCDLIESVGSVSLLEEISKRASKLGITQNVLVEVNIGREASKSGVYPEETELVLEIAARLGAVNVRGLMAIPPFGMELDGNIRYFDAMYKLFVDMRAKKYDNVSMQLLSMGMSDSFEDAILAGANMVRVGTAIFGARV